MVHYLWNIYLEKLSRKFNKISWWTLSVGDPESFHNSPYVKSYYLNLNFSQVRQSALFKSKKKKIFLNKGVRHLKIAWHNKWQNKILKKKKEKRKIRTNHTTVIAIFYLLLFYMEEFLSFWKNIWKLLKLLSIDQVF